MLFSEDSLLKSICLELLVEEFQFGFRTSKSGGKPRSVNLRKTYVLQFQKQTSSLRRELKTFGSEDFGERVWRLNLTDLKHQLKR